MASLSHWDYAAHFSGFEAAALILGMEPMKPDDDHSRIRVVVERMALHYRDARVRHYQQVFDLKEDFQNLDASRPFELESVRMIELRHQWNPLEEVTEFSDWLASNHEPKFDNQIFSRRIIADWLNATKLNSIYQFELDQPSNENVVTGHWPWGDHHTEMLEHLEAAARKHWVNYDPADSGTAPTNVSVSGWLITERKLSKTMADSIASILRADGLPTGPRK